MKLYHPTGVICTTRHNPLDFVIRCYYSQSMLTNDDLTKIKLIVTSGNSQVLKEIDEAKVKIENVKAESSLFPQKKNFSAQCQNLWERSKIPERNKLSSPAEYLNRMIILTSTILVCPISKRKSPFLLRQHKLDSSFSHNNELLWS